MKFPKFLKLGCVTLVLLMGAYVLKVNLTHMYRKRTEGPGLEKLLASLEGSRQPAGWHAYQYERDEVWAARLQEWLDHETQAMWAFQGLFDMAGAWPSSVPLSSLSVDGYRLTAQLRTPNEAALSKVKVALAEVGTLTQVEIEPDGRVVAEMGRPPRQIVEEMIVPALGSGPLTDNDTALWIQDNLGHYYGAFRIDIEEFNQYHLPKIAEGYFNAGPARDGLVEISPAAMVGTIANGRFSALTQWRLPLRGPFKQVIYGMDRFKITGMGKMGFHAATFQVDEGRPGHVQATVELVLLTDYDSDSPKNGPEVTAEWSKPDRFHDGPVRSIRQTYDPTKAADPFAVK